MVPRTRSSRRIVHESDRNSDKAVARSVKQQETTPLRIKPEDISSTLGDPTSPTVSETSSKLSDVPLDLDSETLAAASPATRNSPVCTAAQHHGSPPWDASDEDTDQVLKAPTPSPLTSPSTSPRLTGAETSRICVLPISYPPRTTNEGLTPTTESDFSIPASDREEFDLDYDREEEVKFFSQGNSTSDLSTEISSLHDLDTEDPTNDTSTAVIEKEEDPELERLTKSVESILQDWRGLTVPPQAPQTRRQSVYYPSEFTKALARKVTGRETAAEAKGMLSVDQVGELVESHDKIESGTNSGEMSVKQLTNPASMKALLGKINPQEKVIKPGLSFVTASSTPEKERKQFEEESSKRREEFRDQREIDNELERNHKSTTSLHKETTPATSDGMVSESSRQASSTRTATKENIPALMQSKCTANEHNAQKPEKKPTLVDRILDAVSKSNRKTFIQGDVAIIIDVDDLGKTMLLSSSSLSLQSTVIPGLPDLFMEEENKGAAMGLQYVLILETSGDLSQMPVLQFIEGNPVDIEDWSIYKPYLRLLEAAKKVKDEPQDSEHNGSTSMNFPPLDWVKAYEAFLSIVSTFKSPAYKDTSNLLKLLGSDARSALPQIEGFIDIARRFHSLPAITANVKLLFSRYLGNSTLYDAIAAEAATWLLIGKDFQDEAIFKEAFCHVAGCYPAWPWQKSMTDIPEATLHAIKSKSRDLAIRQQAIQVKLSRITLSVKENKKDKFALPVSQHHEAHKYDVVNFWWHWVAAHVAYLEPDDEEDENQPKGADGLNASSQPRPSAAFCDHSNGQCLNLAKLYRAIATGGDAYLAYDHMMKKWNEEAYDKDDESMRDALDTLKKKAQAIVKPLVKSSLFYQQSDSLNYLTSITVKDEDMPWKKELEDDDGDA